MESIRVKKDRGVGQRSGSGGFQVDSIERLSSDGATSDDITDTVLGEDRGGIFQNDDDLKDRISKTTGNRKEDIIIIEN